MDTSTGYDWLNEIDFFELESLCPKVDSEFFKCLKEYKTGGVDSLGVRMDGGVNEEDRQLYYPKGLKNLRRGFSTPFADLPLLLTDLSYDGLIQGVIRYRLLHGY